MRPVEVRRNHSSHVDQVVSRRSAALRAPPRNRSSTAARACIALGARWYIRFQQEGWLDVERFLWICLAGAAGTGVRYLIALWSTQRLGTAFPYGTLIVNVAGCFAIAAVMYAAADAVVADHRSIGDHDRIHWRADDLFELQLRNDGAARSRCLPGRRAVRRGHPRRRVRRRLARDDVRQTIARSMTCVLTVTEGTEATD